MTNRNLPPDPPGPPDDGQATRRFPTNDPNANPPAANTPPATPGAPNAAGAAPGPAPWETSGTPAQPPRAPWETTGAQTPPPARAPWETTGSTPAGAPAPGTPGGGSPSDPTAVYPVPPTAGLPPEPPAAYPPAGANVVYSTPTQATPPPPPVPPPTGPVYPPPSQGPGPLPWIIGAVVALALLGLLVFLLSNNHNPVVAPTPGPTATATETPVPSPTPATTATATPLSPTETPSPAPPTATPSPAATDTPVPGLPTVTPLPTSTPAPPPTDTVAPSTATSAPVPTTAVPGPGTTPTLPPLPGFTPTPAPSPTTADVTPGATGTAPASGPGTPDTTPAASQEGYLTVQWFGQSSFLLAGGEGVRILIDPVGPSVGYHLPTFNNLDALLISHLHPDHTYTQVVAGGTPNYVGLNANGSFQPITQNVKTAAVRDVGSFHDDQEGRQRGANAMWVIDMDGFHIVHLGDLGQTELDDKQVQQLGQPDILMIPVGGNFTIDGRQARAVMAQLKPRLVIPMHYRTDRTPANLNLAPVDAFLGQAAPPNPPNVVRLKRSDFKGNQTQVLVMNYK
jgi:L-ascorbate metabolism protein UlaG (beta-lactamase superfamily)